MSGFLARLVETEQMLEKASVEKSQVFRFVIRVSTHA